MKLTYSIKRTATVVGILALVSVTAVAQENRSEISVQGTGFFTKDTAGNGVSQHADDTGGFLLGYRYNFNRWLGAEANYGYDRNTQFYFGGTSARVQSDIHQITGSAVVKLPTFAGLHPYALAGAGALVFDPTGNFGGTFAGATLETKAAFVYGVGVPYFWRNYIALDVVSWYGVMAGGKLHPSPAGWWLGCVSLPVLQFLLVRWYFRLYIWARFLWQVSRIELQLLPSHPDGCGGLGFLSLVRQAFAPLLLAQGVLLAGLIANRILFAGGRLPQFLIDVVALVAISALMVFAPLLVFTPKLEDTARMGLLEYGALAQRYVRAFDQKWLRRAESAGEPLLGSADIQSLADMGNSFEFVDRMRWVPFTVRDVLLLAAIPLLPIMPLTLSMFSLQELLERLLKLMF